MAVSAELKLLITASSDAKAAFDGVLKQISALQAATTALQATLGNALGPAANQPFVNVAANAQAASTAVNTFGTSTTAAGAAAARSTPAVNTFGTSIRSIKESSTVAGDALAKLVKGFELLTGGFLAFKAVQIVKDFADTAARTDQLGIVLRVVAENAGIGRQAIDEIDKSVQKLGITASASRQSLAQLIQNRIPVNFAAPLARAAQDLAGVTGLNSSQTFEKLITNITQLDTVGLRFMGIIIDKEQVLDRAAQRAGVALDETSKKAAFAAAVLEKAGRLTGVYEESLNSAGKALTSLDRIFETFKVSVGVGLQPVYLELIKGVQAVVESLTSFMNAVNGVSESVDGLSQRDASGALLVAGSAAKQASGGMKDLAKFIKEVFKSIADGINSLKQYKDELTALAKVVAVAVSAFLLFRGIGFIIGLLGSVVLWIGRVMSAITALIGAIRTFGIVTGVAVSIGLGTFGVALAGIITLLYAAYAAWKLFHKGADDAAKGTGNAQAAFEAFKAAADKELEIRARLDAARSKARDLQEDIQILRQRNAPQGEQEEAAEALKAQQVNIEAITKELTTAKDVVEETNQKYLEATDRTNGLDRQVVKVRDNLLASNTAADRLTDNLNRALEAAKKFNETPTSLQVDIPQDTIQKVRDFHELLGSLNVDEAGRNTAITSERIHSALRQLESIDGAKTKNAYLLIASAIKELEQRTVSAGNAFPNLKKDIEDVLPALARLRNFQKQASDEAELARKFGGTGPLADIRANRNADIDARASSVKDAINEEKAENQRLTAALQAEFDERKIGAEDYFRERTLLSHESFQADRREVAADIEQLLGKRANLPLTDDAGRKNIDAQIRALESRRAISNINETKEVRELQHLKNTLNKQEEFELERLKNLKEGFEGKALEAIDKEAAERAALNKQYDQTIAREEKLIRQRITGTTAEKDAEVASFKKAANEARAADDTALGLKLERERQGILRDAAQIHNQILALTDDEAAAAAEIELKYETQNDALRLQMVGQKEAIRLTLNRAIAENNTLKAIELQNVALDASLKKIERQNALNSARRGRQQSQADLELSRGQITTIEHQQRSNALIEEQIADEQKVKNQIIERLRIETEAFNAKKAAGTLTAEELESQARTLENIQKAADEADGRINQLKTSIQSVGDAWRIGFTQDMSDAFKDVLKRADDFSNAMKKLADKLKNRIFDTVAENAAQKIVGTADSLLGQVFGKDSGFNVLGDLLFPKAPGADKSHPIYAEVTNLPKTGINTPDGVVPFFEQVKKGAGDFFETVKGGFGQAVNLSKGFFSAIGNGFSAIVGGIGKALSSLATGDFGGIWTAIVGIFSGFGGGGGGSTSTNYSGHMAAGGTVPGSGTGDTVPAMLTPGEFVVPAKQSRMFYPLLNAMRRGALMPNLQLIAQRMPNFDIRSPFPTQHFADGGPVLSVQTKSKDRKQPPVVLQINPEALHLTLNQWFESELARISATR